MKLLTLSLITLSIICILSSSAIAAMLDATFYAVDDSIYASNETAIYTVNISNNDNYGQNYQIYTESTFWDIYPSYVQGVVANSVSQFDLEMRPLSNNIFGPQLVPITIKSLKDDRIISQNLFVYLKAGNETIKQYVPNVYMEVKTPEELDARNPLPVEVYMINRNPLNINDLRIQITSDILNKEVQTQLDPLKEKTIQVLFTLDPLLTPGTYNLKITLSANNTPNIAQVQKEIKIKPLFI